ncbi:MAG TPA: PhzF family phenazine biosynthesis isomerase, partial [Spirochaetes bacterium]|nr:PhzF family phenazine biosynthesis isomerase [Spirochaetota bacterium]
MKLKLYQVDAFTNRLFSGNPAAVCPLEGEWLDDALMLSIALENNLSETAFYIKKDGRYGIRWFTPAVEVDLCGHATLASAHVLYAHEGYRGKTIGFDSRSGPLTVGREGDSLVMDFPADNAEEVPLVDELKSCFGAVPVEAYRGASDYM